MSADEKIKTMRMTQKILQSGLIWTWLVLFILLVDRYSKWWVVEHLTPYEGLQILPVFNLTLAYNTGAAFSFLHTASGWQNLFLGSLAVIVSAVIVVWLYTVSRHERWLSIALCFIVAGALGNAWDRILYGYVVDFLAFHWEDWHFAIFNLADSMICVGAFMLFIHWMWQKNTEGQSPP